MQRKIKYLVRSLSNIFQKKQCPNCNSTDLKTIDSKFFVTSLLTCNQCYLNHRHPKDSSRWLKKYYQEEYQIDNSMMTDLPSDQEIVTHKANNFKALRDYNDYLAPFQGDSSLNILDYGCSWGYNVFKLKNSGYTTLGFELSKPRAQFGMDKLGVTIFSELEEIPNDQDILFSSHVIEHLIDLPQFINSCKTWLKKEGVFMAFCPNGNNEYRERESVTWHGSWGDIHVNLIDTAYAVNVFKNNPYLILTGDWAFNREDIENWDGKSQKIGELKNGKELLIIAKPNIEL